jgi:hypothetical protein
MNLRLFTGGSNFVVNLDWSVFVLIRVKIIVIIKQVFNRNQSSFPQHIIAITILKFS